VPTVTTFADLDKMIAPCMGQFLQITPDAIIIRGFPGFTVSNTLRYFYTPSPHPIMDPVREQVYVLHNGDLAMQELSDEKTLLQHAILAGGVAREESIHKKQPFDEYAAPLLDVKVDRFERTVQLVYHKLKRNVASYAGRESISKLQHYRELGLGMFPLVLSFVTANIYVPGLAMSAIFERAFTKGTLQTVPRVVV
jgi:hypothetical protein